MSQDRLRRYVWQAVWLSLFLLPCAMGGLYVWHKHQQLQQHLAELEPRHSRLQGLLQRQEDFATTHQAFEAYLAAHAYPAEQTASEAGNDAQQRIRNVFVDHGLNVASVQVQAVREAEGPFDRIPIVLRVEGPLPALQQALWALHNLRPAVVIDSMNLQTLGASRPASNQLLAVQMAFTVLRVRP